MGNERFTEKSDFPGMGFDDHEQGESGEHRRRFGEARRVGASESKQLVEKLIDRGAEEQTKFKELVNEQVRAALQNMGLASAKEVEELTRRVAELEIKLAEMQQP